MLVLTIYATSPLLCYGWQVQQEMLAVKNFMGPPSDDIDAIIESVMKHRPSNTTSSREYLGDNVYALYDDGCIELRLDNHYSQPLIRLDPLTMQALISFARRQGP
jgi:hypothetical protein